MAETIALIDYGAGNLRSVANALQAAGTKAAGAKDVAVTADPDAVRHADRIILPGVGAFAHCMAALSAIPGMVECLNEQVRDGGKPFLGICVGMQLMATQGEEHGIHQGLGWIPGSVKALTPADPAARVPHMGWNDVAPTRAHPLMHAGEAYYLHSYHFAADNPADILAMSDHGGPIVAAVARDTMVGVQYHPEKSQAYGLALLTRFLDWRP